MVRRVRETVSGVRAKSYAAAISQHHRIQATAGIHDAIEYVRREAGLVSGAQCEVFRYPADGKDTIETWTAPYAWRATAGTLELLEPEKGLLADYTAEPISLVAHSTSVDVEAEVVYVGKGTRPEDYDGLDVEGKVVLCEARARHVHRMACVEHGAVGLLTFVPPSGKDEIAAMRRYDAIWPTGDEKDSTRFGFSLAQADGVKLRQWLMDGKTVRVRARVQAELTEGEMEVLSALIPGQDPSKEVWLFAHICHPLPGANDNASGSAALLEALRTLSSLIERGVVGPLEYSVRFLWGPEWFGTIRFIHNERELLQRCIAMVNLDMVGADPCKAGSAMWLYRTPFSLPTTLNNVVRYWLRNEGEVAREPRRGEGIAPPVCRYARYSAGSDHFMFTDSTVGVPAVMLNVHPDKFYHTSEDTVDKLDPGQLALATRVAVLSTLSLTMPRHTCKELVLNDCRAEAQELLEEVLIRGVRRLARCEGDPDEQYSRLLRQLKYAHELGTATLRRAGEEWHLIAEQERLKDALAAALEMSYSASMLIARKAYEGACAEVGLEAKEEDIFKRLTRESGLEVRRTFKYALNPGYLFRKMGAKALKYMEMREDYRHIMEGLDELFNLARDWTPLDEIWEKVCFQFGDIGLKTLEEIVRDLEEAGLLQTRGVE